MSTDVNKHGLSRYIPADVSLAVRQECGFGCVICGASIIQYEHIDPEFHDAHHHDPGAIALLCSSCHDNVTRKFWSKDKVQAARQAPRCKQTGFSWGNFDFGDHHPEIRVGGVTFRRCTIPIAVRGAPVFQIEKPEAIGAPFRLSANFTRPDGQALLQIRKNEWSVLADVWDTEFTGGCIIIRDKAQSQCLVLRADPPLGIAVERLHMQVGEFTFTGDPETLHVASPKMSMDLTQIGMDGCYIGMSLR